MRDQPGYLDRLLDGVRGPRGRAAQAPNQLAWVSSPISAEVRSEEAVAEPPAPPAGAWQRPAPAAPTAIPAVPSADPPPSPRRLPRRRAEPLSTRVPPGQFTATQPAGPPEARAVHGAPATIKQPPPAQFRAAIPALERLPERAAAAPAAPPRAQTAPGAQPAVLPQAVLQALERLSKLSIGAERLEQPRQPPAAPPAPAAAPPAIAPRAAPDQQRAVVMPPHRRPDEPRLRPQVHIGTIEVTIASPPSAAPAPPASPTPPRPPVTPQPVGRLSRPSPGFGFGQA